MATICLYATPINQMLPLISDIRGSVSNYKSDLFSLNQKAQNINGSLCNIGDVISSIQSSSQTQEEKDASLATIYQNSESFVYIADVIDGTVADVINQSKEDFYQQYSYLKPESEKSGWEKFCDGLAAFGEWCKENWVVIVTVLVVIGIAILCVVTFGIAIAAIAAIAGIVSLVLCLADIICMLATGGKDIATICRENGLGWLGDIFQGLSIGCDVVSIFFPAGAAIKSMVKIGFKTFAKASITAAKKAFKETIEMVFKSGFKKGITNFGKLLFKTFVFDIDDLKNLKAVSLSNPQARTYWTADGDSLIPKSDAIPVSYNPDGMSMEDLLKSYELDSIPIKDGVPDLSALSKKDVPISMKNLDPEIVDNFLSGDLSEKDFSDALRQMNFDNADAELFDRYGLTKKGLESTLNVKLTWHEDVSMKTCSLIPTAIHFNVPHIGGVGNFKFEFKQIPGLSNLVGKKLTQFGFRFESENLVGAFAVD